MENSAETSVSDDVEAIDASNEKSSLHNISSHQENLPSDGGSITSTSVQHQIKKDKKQLVGENLERMNYLFQVSKYIDTREEKEAYCNAGPSLGSLAMAIGRKCLLRVDPSLKRQICKGCGSALIPGVNSTYRLKKRVQKHLLVTCLRCKTIKRFPTNPDYLVWTERPEALVE